jgi:DNA repair protein RadD
MRRPVPTPARAARAAETDRSTPRARRLHSSAARLGMDQSLILRPYQATAVAAICAHWAAGRRRVCCTSPTGSGKTTIAAALLTTAAPGTAVALVHTRTLRAQTRKRLGKGVTVLTIQCALVARPGSAARLALAAATVIFIDEAHHLASASWVKVLALLGPAARVVGMTATPQRADGAALGTGGAGFDALVTTTTYSALVAAGHLARCAVVDGSGAGTPAQAYLQHGGRRPGIIFAPTVAACRDAVAALCAAGVRAAAIDCTTGERARRVAFAAFEAGELDVLASPMALSEGFDSPRAKVCVLDRTCCHVGVYLQTAGRVLRPYHSQSALLIDMRGAAERHGNPTDDRTYSLEGTAIGKAPPRGARSARPANENATTAARSAGRTTGRALERAAGWARGLWARWARWAA